jgi:hypothetical protein
VVELFQALSVKLLLKLLNSFTSEAQEGHEQQSKDRLPQARKQIGRQQNSSSVKPHSPALQV